MDDTRNDQFANPPKAEDLIRICRSLNENGAKYLLIGGFAVILHGYVRATKDIDFLVDSSVENIQKIKKALSILADNAAAELKDDEVAQYTVVRIADEFVIDLMAKACSVDYEEAKNFIDLYETNGIQIPVANKEILIKMKDTVRPSDKTDVQFLKALIAEEKNKS